MGSSRSDLKNGQASGSLQQAQVRHETEPLATDAADKINDTLEMTDYEDDDTGRGKDVRLSWGGRFQL